MTTRDLNAGNNNPVVIDVKVNDNQANRKLDQTRGKVNNLRGPFLGGALLGGFFGAALLGIAINSGVASSSTDRLSGSISRLLNTAIRPLEPAANAVLNEFERLPPTIQSFITWGIVAIIFRKALFSIIAVLQRVGRWIGVVITIATNLVLTFKNLVQAGLGWRRSLGTIFDFLRARLPIITNIINILRRIGDGIRWVWRIARQIWQAIVPFTAFAQQLNQVNQASRFLRFGWIALGIVLALLGVLILDQIFGWGILDKILGKFGTSVQEVNEWIDEQIKRFITEARWLRIIIGLFGAAALSMAYLGGQTRKLLIKLEDFAKWVVDRFVKTVGNAFVGLGNIIIEAFNAMIRGYNAVAKLAGWPQGGLIPNIPEFQYTPFNQRSAGRMWYDGGTKYGPNPTPPVTIQVFGNVYGTDDIGQLIEDAFRADPNIQGRIQGAP